MFTWWQQLWRHHQTRTTRRKAAPRLRGRQCPPRVERLEDRTLLAGSPFQELAARLEAPLTTLQSSLDQALSDASKVPLLKGELGNISQARVLTSNVINKLKTELNKDAATDDEVKTNLKTALGTLLGDRTGDQVANEQDITITHLGAAGVQVELRLHQDLVSATLPAGFKLDLALSGLPFPSPPPEGIDAK